MERTMAYYGDNYANLPPEIRCHFENINMAKLNYEKGTYGHWKIKWSIPRGKPQTVFII